MGDSTYTATDNSTSIESTSANGVKVVYCFSEIFHYYGVHAVYLPLCNYKYRYILTYNVPVYAIIC